MKVQETQVFLILWSTDDNILVLYIPSVVNQNCLKYRIDSPSEK